MTPDKKTISSCFEDYLLECEYSKGLRPKTIDTYRDVFKNFSNVMFEVRYIDELEPYLVQEFFKRLGMRANKNGKPLKTSSKRTYFNKLNAFFKWLERNELIQDDFISKLVKPPNPTYEDEKSLSNDEISKIIGTINLYSIDNVFMQRRDLVIIYLLLYTGIRRGELLGLKIQDVNFANKTLFVNGRTSKSKKSRYIPLHFTVLTHLKLYLSIRKSMHFICDALIVSTTGVKGLTDHGLRYWVEKYNRLSGIRFHIHQFRHTFACNLAKKNANIISIKNVLGHSSTQMTEHYLRSIKTESARSPIENLEY
ncbi:MAG: hypothetical protein COW66_13070 [Flavobacteriaceae bacterium CG18_big_fil_WC_8_21_14_2_50_34_36]|nr:site-specific integrase [Flavobacteriia bacterium]NCT18045.1 site-specific integrase [Flavobacteriia bacterium]PIQ17198.1 MAG: hypothetical protein COW66_13070 [Flavobacteriaceae bacterium CG18_big_fil_WC_8_21_14_2_50_34_36]PJC08208.1 MAG: hypothetical protein CO068_02165 [Flavobacteriaceae bacterium CG_4_9_14_0_8_um_filter_34_30]